MPSDPAERRGVLYVVATPIGNLADLSERARSTLSLVECVLAEDTRRTRTLLTHLGLQKELRRLDAHAAPHEIDAFAERIASGGNFAVVTDAGTPVVSDPGSALVRAARARGATIVPIPGASAVTAALSAAGYELSAFRFVGFLPRSGMERDLALSKIASDDDAIVFFESPHRIQKTLEELAEREPERRALIARELTKLHEELIEGTLGEIVRITADKEWLGELTIVLAPKQTIEVKADASDADVAKSIELRATELLAAGRRAKDVAELIALETGAKKRDVYEIVSRLKRG